MTAEVPPLSGTLHVLPFAGGTLANRVADIYQDAVRQTSDFRDVLVLKRLPNGVPEFAAALGEAADITGQPNVKSIARQARTVLEESDASRDVLSYEERIEFLANVLRGRNWSDYFETASAHDSFGRDVGQLLLNATWQGGFAAGPESHGDYDHLTDELADVNEAFHDRLADRGLIEAADVVPQAIEALADETVRERIEREYDLVLAVEFEEFTRVEREYLAALSTNVDLVCVAERHASIERVRKEARDVTQFTGDLDVVDHTTANSERDSGTPGGSATNVSGRPARDATAGHPFGAFLATGDVPVADETADARPTAYHIEGETFEAQVREVANEIEYLRQANDWAYDDVAVLLRSIGDPMPKVRRVLQHSGVPTASAGVGGLEQDLAVRELHALAQYHIDGSDRARRLLEARVPTFDDELADACVVPHSIHDSLRRWIVNTDLKRRIAAEHADLDAREQFQNVSRLLSIAEFVDDQDFLASDWPQFVRMLERAITYDAPYAHTAEVDVQEGGVLVGDVSLVKNETRKAVFLLDVVENEYPGDASLSALFPTPWIREMGQYPAVTRPTRDDVTETFAPATDPTGDLFERYHAEVARRRLAVGARAAAEKLYFCTYRSSAERLGKRQHESRYLRAIRDHDALALERVEGAGHDRAIYTLGSASARILAEPWNELERIQAAASVGREVDLETTEQRLAAIQTVLEESEDVDPRFIEAVHTHMDLARGEVLPSAEEDESRNGGESDE